MHFGFYHFLRETAHVELDQTWQKFRDTVSRPIMTQFASVISAVPILNYLSQHLSVVSMKHEYSFTNTRNSTFENVWKYFISPLPTLITRRLISYSDSTLTYGFSLWRSSLLQVLWGGPARSPVGFCLKVFWTFHEICSRSQRQLCANDDKISSCWKIHDW